MNAKDAFTKAQRVASTVDFEVLLSDHRLRKAGKIYLASKLIDDSSKLSHCTTGFPILDNLMKGGFPRGRLIEITGPASSGRTSLALSVLAQLTISGEFTSWIEIGDALDPLSAATAGVVLEHVLWIKASSLTESFRTAERVIREGCFALLLIDICGSKSPISNAVWLRLRRHAMRFNTCLVVLGGSRSSVNFSDLVIELQHAQPCFTGTPPLLKELKGKLFIARNRFGRDSLNIPFSTAST